MRKLNLKALIASVAGLTVITAYILYYFIYSVYNYRLDQVYFMATCFGVSVFTALLFTFFTQRFARTIMLFVSNFYAILLITYVANWLAFGTAYGHIKLSLIIGFIAGLIYYAYDSIVNSKPKD
jgi:Na+/melibiose symporter-like transporter